MNVDNENSQPQQQPISQETIVMPKTTEPIVPKPGPSGKAITTLILGILSLICCGFFTGIPAIIIGKQEMNAIKEGKSNQEGYTLAQIGFILGIVGTALSCLGFIIYGLIAVLGISMGIMESVQEGV